MLALGSWLPIAESLHLEDGRSRRVNHDCGEGTTLKIAREGATLSAYCFRCNDHGRHTLAESLADRVARLTRSSAADADAKVSREVPTGETDPRKWPVEAFLWFLRAGLSSEDVGKLKGVFAPDLGRVILPLGGGYWQGRAVSKGQVPKYLAPVDVPKAYPCYGDAGPIVLVEDILSAYKVGKAGFRGWCMLGTSLPAELLARILREQDARTYVWLDNDLPPTHARNSGQIAARKVLATLRAAGCDVRNVVTDTDPKLIPISTIKEILS